MADGAGLAARLVGARSPEDAVRTVLRTSDRVLARITDGIYRQPGSALRELLANAYDADATRVAVFTDRPRFGTIRVEDDGMGMSPEMIEYVLENIGGSSKRVAAGAELGVTSSEDRCLSPGGRRLIGKIGIGLFSVSQLARSFHIVTKQQGDGYYSIIRFLLKQYADDGQADDDGRHEAGLALLWQEAAEDRSAHGTTVVLDPLRPEAVHRLRSADEWQLLDTQPDGRSRQPPTYHIGRVQAGSDEHLEAFGDGAGGNGKGGDSGDGGWDGGYAALPWDASDSPSEAFRKLTAAIGDTAGESMNNTKLEGICDRYLRMVWELALALPLPYVGADPIRDPLDSSILAYRLQPGKAAAAELGGLGESPLARILGLPDKAGGGSGFRVVVDDLELKRPLVFSDFPVTQRARQEPLLLCGSVSEAFKGQMPEFSGGPLEFHAYLLWAPKLVPRDRAGALVRIHGSSGTGFDAGFFRYQTREKIRISQTSCEIFVTRGLEGALNIDRESFNYAHPHVAYLSQWLHNALTSLFSKEKQLSTEVRKHKRSTAKHKKQQALGRVTARTWREETGSDEEPPVVEFVDAARTSHPEAEALPADSYRLRLPEIHPDIRQAAPEARPGPVSAVAELEAIFQVLASFGLLDSMDGDSRQRLAAALAEVLEVGERA